MPTDVLDRLRTAVGHPPPTDSATLVYVRLADVDRAIELLASFEAQAEADGLLIESQRLELAHAQADVDDARREVERLRAGIPWCE